MQVNHYYCVRQNTFNQKLPVLPQFKRSCTILGHLVSLNTVFLLTFTSYHHERNILISILIWLLEFYCSLHFPKILNYSFRHMHTANSVSCFILMLLTLFFHSARERTFPGQTESIQQGDDTA